MFAGATASLRGGPRVLTLVQCSLAEAIRSAPDSCRVCYRRSDGSRDDCRLDRGRGSRQPFGQHDRGAARGREADCLSLGRGGCPEGQPRLRHRRREHVASPAHGRARALHRGGVEDARGVAGRLPRTGQEQLAGGLHRDDERPVDQVRAEQLPAGQPGDRQGHLPSGRQEHLPPAAGAGTSPGPTGSSRCPTPARSTTTAPTGLATSTACTTTRPSTTTTSRATATSRTSPPRRRRSVCTHDLPMGTTASERHPALRPRPGQRTHPAASTTSCPTTARTATTPAGARDSGAPVRRVRPSARSPRSWPHRPGTLDLSSTSRGTSRATERRTTAASGASGSARRSSRASTAGHWSHASLLRTVEDQFGLAHIHRAQTAPVIGTIWR